jgi:hypothetical protein
MIKDWWFMVDVTLCAEGDCEAALLNATLAELGSNQ